MSTPTTSLQLQQITTGDQSGTWGTSTNTNMQLIDDSIAGVASITFDGINNYTLSNISYASDEARKIIIIANGSPGSSNQIVAPLVTKFYVVVNRTNTAIIIGATTGTTVSIPYTATPSAMIVYCDGTDFKPASNSTSGTFTASIFSGAGTGLIGTAAGLSIGGNAATATSATSATTTTNIANGAAGYIPYQTSSGNTSFLALGTSSYVLTAGSTAPQYVAQNTLSVGSATTATNLNSGTTGALAYQTTANTTGFLSLGTTNYVLTAGASAPQYVAQSTLSVGSATSATTATTATNVAGGAANRIPYQTGSSATSFIVAPTTASTALTWNGSAYVWGSTGGPVAGGVVYENGQTISSNYTMTSGNNGMSAGPITVATGVTVTIPTGSNWVIV